MMFIEIVLEYEQTKQNNDFFFNRKYLSFGSDDVHFHYFN